MSNFLEGWLCVLVHSSAVSSRILQYTHCERVEGFTARRVRTQHHCHLVYVVVVVALTFKRVQRRLLRLSILKLEGRRDLVVQGKHCRLSVVSSKGQLCKRPQRNSASAFSLNVELARPIFKAFWLAVLIAVLVYPRTTSDWY